MIKNVAIGRVVLHRPHLRRRSYCLLSLLQKMGLPLEPPLNAIVADLGFDSFMFGMSTTPNVSHESQSYVFTTLAFEWVMRYDEKHYVEVDPRVLKTRDSTIPLL